MGKKQKEVLDKMKPICGTGCQGHDATILEKFGKTGHLRVTPLISRTLLVMLGLPTKLLFKSIILPNIWLQYYRIICDIKVSFFMEECKRMGLQVLGPDVNESFINLL
jgi:DNA polymerase-3 subunit alpha